MGSAIDTGDGSLSGVREAMKGAEQGGGGGELAELNRELNTSLGRFDGALLGERERSQAQSEAAMKEKDPELRAKLWDEYRKYVNTAKGKS